MTTGNIFVFFSWGLNQMEGGKKPRLPVELYFFFWRGWFQTDSRWKFAC